MSNIVKKRGFGSEKWEHTPHLSCGQGLFWCDNEQAQLPGENQDNGIALRLEDLIANYGQAMEPHYKICIGSSEEAVKPYGV